MSLECDLIFSSSSLLKKNNLVNMSKKQLKIREKGQNSLTKFQLSYFSAAENPTKQGFLTSGTIEWE